MRDGIHPVELLDGVVITPLREIPDARGAVLPILRSDAPDFSSFGECYFSEVVPGAVKAWKRHRSQTQNFAVPAGRIRMVIYDDREGSATKGRLEVFELGRPDRHMRLRIPSGVWYGFACVGPVTALVANCTDLPHDPEEGETRPSDDTAIPYTWNARKS